MRLLLLLAFLLLHYSGHAQQRLAQARQQSYLTKTFRISEEQARHLYEHGLKAARPEFFTQAVDSFPTAKPRHRVLPLGYYLVAHTEGPHLVYELRTETDREILVIDNQVDLTLVVRDSLGRLLTDAQVALAGRPLPFDAATQSYRRAKGGRAGLLAVTQAGRTAFTVRTALAGQTGTRVLLRAGQPAELVVTVDVKAEARYVLLEVPIPAGCSYGEPAQPSSLETHREYLRHQTGIFLDYLPVGRHQFRIALQPRFRGVYTINPTKAELVYFPTRFGRSASKRAVVE